MQTLTSIVVVSRDWKSPSSRVLDPNQFFTYAVVDVELATSDAARIVRISRKVYQEVPDRLPDPVYRDNAYAYLAVGAGNEGTLCESLTPFFFRFLKTTGE